MGFFKFKKKESEAKQDTSLDIPPPPPLDEGDLQPPTPSMPQMDNITLPTDMNVSQAYQPRANLSQTGGVFSSAPKPRQIPPKPQDFSTLSQNIQPSLEIQESDILDQSNLDFQPSSVGQDMPNLEEAMPQDDTTLFPEKDIMTSRKSFDELFPSSRTNKFAPSPTFSRGVMESDRVFVEVNHYRELLRDLNLIKKSLKNSHQEVGNIIKDIDEEEKIFSTLHESLGEVQKKLAELETLLAGQ